MTTDGLLNIAALTAGIIMVLILLAMDFRSAWISVLVSVFVSVPLYLISGSFVPFLVLFLSVSSVKLLYSRLFFLVAPFQAPVFRGNQQGLCYPWKNLP